MTIAAPLLPGVVTRSRAATSAKQSPSASPKANALAAASPLAKRTRVTTPSTAHHASTSASANLEQWLADVSNVDISLSVSITPPEIEATCLSIPDMLTRLLQTKLAIDPNRLTTRVKGGEDEKNCETAAAVFVALCVKGREEPIQDAIEGGLTPRKAFLRSAPHISRVASRLQDCMRQIFGIDDFVVKVE
jgi:hypothetical protein